MEEEVQEDQDQEVEAMEMQGDIPRLRRCLLLKGKSRFGFEIQTTFRTFYRSTYRLTQKNA